MLTNQGVGSMSVSIFHRSVSFMPAFALISIVSSMPGVQEGCVCVRAKSLYSCLTLCGIRLHQAPGNPEILQARTLERVAISFSNAWKLKVKVKLLSHVRLLATPWTAAYQAPPRWVQLCGSLNILWLRNGYRWSLQTDQFLYSFFRIIISHNDFIIKFMN